MAPDVGSPEPACRSTTRKGDVMNNENRPEETTPLDDQEEIKVDELSDENLEDAAGGSPNTNCDCNCSPH
jgi:hypothetical protein